MNPEVPHEIRKLLKKQYGVKLPSNKPSYDENENVVNNPRSKQLSKESSYAIEDARQLLSKEPTPKKKGYQPPHPMKKEPMVLVGSDKVPVISMYPKDADRVPTRLRQPGDFTCRTCRRQFRTDTFDRYSSSNGHPMLKTICPKCGVVVSKQASIKSMPKDEAVKYLTEKLAKLQSV